VLPGRAAADEQRQFSHYLKVQYNTEQGLPQGVIHGIAQTPDGFMWFGTRDGLARFDGIRFTVFRSEDNPGLAHNVISRLMADHSGRLWISTVKGLSCYQRDKFISYGRKDGLPDSMVHLGTESLGAFQKIKFTSSYPSGAVLFVEGQSPRGVYMLCKGRVKLTMASAEGRTVIMRIVEAAELLGLHASISGQLHEVTAETLQPCQVDFVRRDDFLKLLNEHRDAAMNAMEQFSNYYRGACQQIRYLGLTPFGG
jgi:ligand-binding sensor domain-containing protein